MNHYNYFSSANVVPLSAVSIYDMLSRVTSRLRAEGLDQARLLSEQLISHIMHCGRLELHSRANEPVGVMQCRRIHNGCERMCMGKPLDYILGKTDFMGRSFLVDSRCMIPRPETEMLVSWISGYEKLWQHQNPFIIDVGTGSGCIVISLVLNKPHAKYMAIDISEDTLSLAIENAMAHGVYDQIEFMTNHLLRGIETESLNAVISNPPYVRTADLEQLPYQIRKHEPHVALDGGDDGLRVINELIDQAFRVLKSDGFLFMETGEDQWPQIHERLHSAGFHNCQLKQDLAGKNRIVCAEK